MSATSKQQRLRANGGHSPGRERPLGSYGVLMAAFSALAAAFATWFRRSGRQLPDRMGGHDLMLLSVAGHKIARLIAKDRVTSPVRAPFTRYVGDAGPGEVSEEARGRGPRRAIGELLVCPYCLSMWTSAGLTALLLVLPRFTRWFASVFATFFGAELLQMAYKKAEETIGDSRPRGAHPPG